VPSKRRARGFYGDYKGDFMRASETSNTEPKEDDSRYISPEDILYSFSFA
jgi:hypothetical protein